MDRKKLTIQKLIQIIRTKPTTRRQAVRRKRIIIALAMRLAILLFVILLVLLIATGVRSCSRKKAEKKAAAEVKAQQEKEESGTLKLGFTGCMILHQSILSSYLDENGIYDFTEPFQYVESYYQKADIMTCEMEGCIGNENTGISGYPLFCYPDVFPGNLQSVGIDMQMLATNHIYDGKSEGLSNTLSVYKEQKVPFTGIRAKNKDKRYKIVKKKGMKIGYVDYTYGTPTSFNALSVDEKDAELINMFREASPEDFYQAVEDQIKAMREDGAEFIIYNLHWGVEYDLEPSEDQKAIAQKLCDLGVDVIIGGHPHVIQPIEVLKSEDGKHKTFCIYSIGNAFSNQTKGVSTDTAHCEDGVILSMDLKKNDKGKVTITDMDMVPTWVYREKRKQTKTKEEIEQEADATLTAQTEEGEEAEDDANTLYNYAVLPLDNVKKLEKKTGLSGVRDSAQRSYDRTMKILGEGFEEAKKELVKSK